MRWLKTMRAFWRLLNMKTRSFSSYAPFDWVPSQPLKNQESRDSSTLASETKATSPSRSNTMALTRADGQALIRSISRISPVEIRRKRHLRTQWLRPMVTSLSTATRLKSRRVSSSGWQAKMMLSSSSARERMFTPSSRRRSTTDQFPNPILWNGSLAKPVFWV